ncbi:hypothetical protein [Paraflavitalea sp. CAU 1676]|uniref:hypothetical protein n=1 Tax=Paraflavitalea sp. CAU 1676 TaxID=3032598 RepID=UPI0023DB4623|nr:hypothetical protein [Paraflavitalea sp. CAU 1676]MDF2193381.1 hypothetical protein [Paraflavitalea sp. CAU 1676]
MENKITLEHLTTLCDANGVLGKKKPKALAFEFAPYGAKKTVNLIICLQNVNAKFETALKFRNKGQLDGSFSFEHDGIAFARDANKKFIDFNEEVLTKRLPETMAVFEELAQHLGYTHCKSMDRYPGSPQEILFHIWMGNQMA